MTTTTIGSGIRVGNGLSLLANKCASRSFDISSGMVYASMRDQIVRAQLLIRDLRQSDVGCQRILVVGAGIGGMTAAACAANLGLDVVVLETKSSAFALQRGVTSRMLGPFMYEWPSILSRFQHYPPEHANLAEELGSTPTWTAANPISANELVGHLDSWFEELRENHDKLKCYFDVDADATKQYVRSFVEEHSRLTVAGSPAASPVLELPDGARFQPDYVVLAVGMGTERVHLIDGEENSKHCVKGPAFWSNDDLKTAAASAWRVGVFGGGDGALQDVLRLLTRHDHPLEFMSAIDIYSGAIAGPFAAVLPELDTLEQQCRLLRTWSADVYELIDVKCQQIAAGLAAHPAVVKKVCAQLRKGSGKVTHVHRGSYFTKAYLLNRFCVHLIEQCLMKRTPKGTVSYERIQSTDAKWTLTLPDGEIFVKLTGGRSIRLDRVVVRFGPSKDELEKRQLIKLKPETQEDRTSMAGIPLPYVVAR